jgi:hypothetical protein
MSATIFEKNLAALRATSPAAAHAVLRAGDIPCGVDIYPARSGAFTARYADPDGRTTHMHSAFDPESEARKFAFSCAPAFGKWIVWLGPGLWHGVRAMRERMFHCPLCVVEPDTAFFKAVLETVPLHDILCAPGVRVITGAPDSIRAEFEAGPVRTDAAKNVIVFMQAAERMPAVFHECLSVIHAAVSAAPCSGDPLNAVRAQAFGPVRPKDFRIIVSANDRYADAVAQTFEPAGACVKTIFDFPGTEAMLAFEPRLLFVFSANLMRWPDTLTLMRGLRSKTGAPLLVWNMEDPMYFADPQQRALIMETARAADLYLTQSAQYLHVYEAEGVRAAYLPTGARPDMMGSPLPHDQQALDFSFFGFWTPWRRAFFDTLAALLPDMAFRLVEPGMAPEQYRDMIRRTRVNLTALTNCDVTARDHWAVSDRVWEIPYAGGFLLQDDRRHIHDHFPDNEIAVFTDARDCAEKIRFYAGNPHERSRIIEAARARIAREHLWAHRMESALEMLLERELLK